MRYCSRNFSDYESHWILRFVGITEGTDIVSTPSPFCEHFEPRKAKRSLKGMNCLVALAKLHQEDIIFIPPNHRFFARSRKHTKRNLLAQPNAPRKGS